MKLHRRWTVGFLLAGLLAAGNGAADDKTGADSGDHAREQARKAVETAARDAARAVQDSNQLALDIRLIGPTSVKIAGDPQGAP
jgi:hypothetical protein